MIDLSPMRTSHSGWRKEEVERGRKRAYALLLIHAFPVFVALISVDMCLHPGPVGVCPTPSYQVSVDDTRLFQVGHALTHVQAHAQQGLGSKEPPLAAQVIWQAAVFHELKHQADGGLLQAHSIELDQLGVREFPGEKWQGVRWSKFSLPKIHSLPQTKMSYWAETWRMQGLSWCTREWTKASVVGMSWNQRKDGQEMRLGIDLGENFNHWLKGKVGAEP